MSLKCARRSSIAKRYSWTMSDFHLLTEDEKCNRVRYEQSLENLRAICGHGFVCVVNDE